MNMRLGKQLRTRIQIIIFSPHSLRPLCQAAAAYYNRLINENCRHLQCSWWTKGIYVCIIFICHTLETHLVINHRLNRFCGFCTLQFGRFMGQLWVVLRLNMLRRGSTIGKLKVQKSFNQSMAAITTIRVENEHNNNKLNKLFGELILTMVFLGEFYSSTVDHQFWNGSDEN